jgi:hypothetical protein
VGLNVDWRPKPPVLESEESNLGYKAASGAAGGALEGLGASVEMLSGCGDGYCAAAVILLSPVLLVGGAVVGALMGAGESQTIVN